MVAHGVLPRLLSRVLLDGPSPHSKLFRGKATHFIRLFASHLVSLSFLAGCILAPPITTRTLKQMYPILLLDYFFLFITPCACSEIQ